MSLATFLTALCSFDSIFLESSSSTDHSSSADVHEVPKSDYRERWVLRLLEMLPNEVSSVIYAECSPTGNDWTEDVHAQKTAFDIFCSPLRETVMLRGGEKLPNVYSAPDYRFRKDFLALNANAGSP